MGRVYRETRNEGRGQHEWDYMPLSEERVVGALIRSRSKVDAAYRMMLDGAPLLASSGACQMSEPIQCTYIDLDKLITRCGLSAAQLEIVECLMRGDTLSEIAHMRACELSTVDVQYRRALGKIVRRNNADWLAFAERMKRGLS